MKRLLSIITLVLALVALSGPSFGMGLGLRGVVHHGDVVVNSDGSPALVWKCKELGGKRVLPCHPDLGVLLAAAAGRAPEPTTRALAVTILLGSGQPPHPELPPPRLG